MRGCHLSFPLLCLFIACQQSPDQDAKSQLNLNEETYVMLEVPDDTNMGDLVKRMRNLNTKSGYPDLRMSSTSVQASDGAQYFLIVRAFPDLAKAQTYVQLLLDNHYRTAFAIPETQYKECMEMMSFDQYKALYHESK